MCEVPATQTWGSEFESPENTKRQAQRHSLGTPVLGREKREVDSWNSPTSQPSPSDPHVQWQTLSPKVKVKRESGRHLVPTSTWTYIHVYTHPHDHTHTVLTHVCIHTNMDLVIIECLIFAKPRLSTFQAISHWLFTISFRTEARVGDIAQLTQPTGVRACHTPQQLALEPTPFGSSHR